MIVNAEVAVLLQIVWMAGTTRRHCKKLTDCSRSRKTFPVLRHVSSCQKHLCARYYLPWKFTEFWSTVSLFSENYSATEPAL